MGIKKIKGYRWIVLVLIFFATTINYLDRQLIGLLKPTLEAEFNWSETDFAHIVMAFTAAYAIGLMFFGRLIDRVGTKIGYSISVFVWSAAGMLHALSSSVVGFAAARIGLGLGEAGNFPAGVKAIAEWFPKKERGIATGIFNAGTSIGVVMALFIVPYILTIYGWKEVFWITGALGMVWLFFWLRFYEIPSRQKRLHEDELELIKNGQENESEEGAQTKVLPWRVLMRLPQTWAFITGKLLIDPIYWFFLFWLPSYFSSTFKLDLTKPSPELMLIYLATTIGSIGGGYFSSSLIKRGWDTIKARKFALLVFALFQISIVFCQFLSNVWLAVALMSAVVAVHQAWATNMFTLASDMFPKSSVSTVVGIGGTAGAFGGILFPMLIGFLLDTYKKAGSITAGYNVIFLICGLTYLCAWLIIHFLLKKSEKTAIYQP
ncbi:Hexuronate transporter [compost metagenome]